MKLFDLFPKKKIIKSKSESDTEKVYSFIWYKKLINKSETYFTKPFRTKIKAKNRIEAKEKLKNLVLGKMQLIIVDETEFSKDELIKDELIKMQKQFDKLNEHFNKIFSKFNDITKNQKN
jgi:hypothetical protein